MSRWHFVLAIWLSFLPATELTTSVGLCLADAAPSSSGPTSLEEAAILWKDGKQAFEASRFQDAQTLLRRFVDRYPGSPGYLEAHLVLGQAYLMLKQPAAAHPEIKYFISGTKDPHEAQHARFFLGITDLQLGHYDEALLLSTEIEKKLGPHPDREALARALLLRTEALIGLNQDARALESHSSAQNYIMSPQTPAPLKGVWNQLGLKLKTRACSRFPTAPVLEEGQAKAQMKRKGECLDQATVLYRTTLLVGDKPSAEFATQTISDAFKDYSHSCINPPAGAEIKPEKRNAQQNAEYLRELAAYFQDECRNKFIETVHLTEGWQEKMPSSMRTYVDHFVDSVQNLARKK